jgi:hypothetical protein
MTRGVCEIPPPAPNINQYSPLARGAPALSLISHPIPKGPASSRPVSHVLKTRPETVNRLTCRVSAPRQRNPARLTAWPSRKGFGKTWKSPTGPSVQGTEVKWGVRSVELGVEVHDETAVGVGVGVKVLDGPAMSVNVGV